MGGDPSHSFQLRRQRQIMKSTLMNSSVSYDLGYMHSELAKTIYRNKFSHDLGGGNKEEWKDTAARVVGNVMNPYMPSLMPKMLRYVSQRKAVPAGRYLASTGRRYPQVNNCFLFRVEDSREGWSDLAKWTMSALMTGGGIGVDYSHLREENSPIHGMGGKSTGPCALMNIINEQGRWVKQGGSRRSAVWAGLIWKHKDIFKFIDMKNWAPHIREMRSNDFNFPVPMDGTNISVILDTEFFTAYHDCTHQLHDLAYTVYWRVIENMLRMGEPGFSIDCGENEGENLRNACTEVTSADNLDMCNLLSVNMARVNTLEEFIEIVDTSIAFLLCGTLYSNLPIQEMHKVREKNRRLGLGLMGIHEWLLRRGYRYGPCDELGDWMRWYAQSGSVANRYADKLSISRPVATRSIAPTGTISIVAETTSGIEPIFSQAYKRRFLDGVNWKVMYVLDSTGHRLRQEGVDPKLIEDAYDLAEDIDRRLGFQSWMQTFVDHGISSTLNLPPWGSSTNNEHSVKNFGNKLMTQLPFLRGITAYPDGSRGGQPLNRVSYEEAVAYAHLGEFVEERESASIPGAAETCQGGFCNS